MKRKYVGALTVLATAIAVHQKPEESVCQEVPCATQVSMTVEQPDDHENAPEMAIAERNRVYILSSPPTWTAKGSKHHKAWIAEGVELWEMDASGDFGILPNASGSFVSRDSLSSQNLPYLLPV
jgi:hypothetical protein